MFSSIIITTYNRPEALNMVLRALNKQKNKKFEVIVADDGSDKDTQLMISALEISLILELDMYGMKTMVFVLQKFAIKQF